MKAEELNKIFNHSGDTVSWEMLQDYQAGKLSAEESAWVERVLESDALLSEGFEGLDSGSKHENTASVNRINDRIAGKWGTVSPPPAAINWSWITGIAAGVAALFTVGYFLLKSGTVNDTAPIAKTEHPEAQNGQAPYAEPPHGTNAAPPIAPEEVEISATSANTVNDSKAVIVDRDEDIALPDDVESVTKTSNEDLPEDVVYKPKEETVADRGDFTPSKNAVDERLLLHAELLIQSESSLNQTNTVALNYQPVKSVSRNPPKAKSFSYRSYSSKTKTKKRSKPSLGRSKVSSRKTGTYSKRQMKAREQKFERDSKDYALVTKALNDADNGNVTLALDQLESLTNESAYFVPSRWYIASMELQNDKLENAKSALREIADLQVEGSSQAEALMEKVDALEKNE